jgi:hypothetical protein
MTSGAFNTIKDTNQKVLNRATAQAIGVDAAELSNPVLATAQRQISAVYNKAANPTVQKLDQMYVMNGIDLIDAASEGLTTLPIKSNIFVKQLQDYALKGEATGNQLTTLSSKLGKKAKKEMTTQSGDRDLGEALFQIKEIVDDQLMAGMSAADQAAFRIARSNYRNLMTVRTTSGVINPSSGNVSGLNLASALTRKDPRGFMEGSNTTPMYEAARFAQAFRPIVGDSGTATRMMELTPLNMMLSMPTNIAAKYAETLIYQNDSKDSRVRGTAAVRGLNRFLPSVFLNNKATNLEVISAVNSAFENNEGKLEPMLRAFFSTETFACSAD